MAPCHGPESLLTRVFAELGHFEQTVRCYETLTATALDMDLDARDLGISGSAALAASGAKDPRVDGHGSCRTPSSSRRLVGHMVLFPRWNNVAKRYILLKGVIVV
jgi:hypothetical protein